MFPKISHTNPNDAFWINEGCYILELLNNPDDPDLSIAKAKVEQGETTQWHYLKTSVERYVILEGRGLVEVGDLGPLQVGPGSVVRIPAGCRQRITCQGCGELIFLCLCTPRFQPEDYVHIEGE